MVTDKGRYTRVAVALHWIMAVAFFLMLGSGLYLEFVPNIEQALKFNLYQWHKSLGVLLLMAFVLRLGWRLFHKPPALPESIKGLERKAAHAGHWGLYAFMIIMPFSGWLMVSSSVYGLPTVVFGWFTWPHIPNLTGNKGVSDLAHEVHETGAYLFILLILGHIAAVIKHAIVDKHNLLPRMWFSVLLLFMLALPKPAGATDYVISSENSFIKFGGTHAGKEFEGTFENWDGNISFDKNDLENSNVYIVIHPKSAKTGDKMYDGTLPTADWFDVKNHPDATFQSSSFSDLGDGRYKVGGTLMIKNIKEPLNFVFTLADLEDGSVLAESAFAIDRMAYDLGLKSDPKAEWVGRVVNIQLQVRAIPAVTP